MDGLEDLRRAAQALELEEADMWGGLPEHEEGAGQERRARKHNSKYTDDFVDHDGRPRSLDTLPKDNDAARAWHSSTPSAPSDKHKVSLFCGQL